MIYVLYLVDYLLTCFCACRFNDGGLFLFVIVLLVFVAYCGDCNSFDAFYYSLMLLRRWCVCLVVVVNLILFAMVGCFVYYIELLNFGF